MSLSLVRLREKRLMAAGCSRSLLLVGLSLATFACSDSDAASGGDEDGSPVAIGTPPTTTAAASSNPQSPAESSSPVAAGSPAPDDTSAGGEATVGSAQQEEDNAPAADPGSGGPTQSGIGVDADDAGAPVGESTPASMPSPDAEVAMSGSDGGPSMQMPPRESDDAASEDPATSEEPTGTCTESQVTRMDVMGSGPHQVIIETNSDPGIDEGTIFRPADLGGDEKYPILVWGQGACSRDGLANEAAMVEIASHGYFVVADGTPDGSGNRTMDRADMEAMGAPLIAYIDWAVAENDKPCSAYYQSLDTAMISSNGFSCGGLMAQGTVTDPRLVTWGVTSSGMAGAPQAFYEAIDTPVLFVEGGPSEVAYDGGLEGYEAISALGVPVLWFSKDIGHGGDLFQPGGGDFTRINLAWLNWWLKGDESITGKALLVGAECPYCSDPSWEVMSTNLP